MSRGRKSLSSSITDNWERAFFNAIGHYITLINKGLSKSFKSEPLSNHIKIIGGYAFKNSEYRSSGIPIIRISDFNSERIVLDDVVYYEESPLLGKYELEESDIIIALTGGTIGKLGIVQAGLGKLYLNQRVGKFDILNPEEFEKEYIYWIARGVEAIVKNLAWGAAIPNVSPKQIEELNFPIPTKDIQKSIIRFLIDLRDDNGIDEVYFDKEIEHEIKSVQERQVKALEIQNELNYQLALLENLNQAILQEAVQGKLVPQDKNDEPASELLKRIKAEKAKLGKKEKPLPHIKPEEIPFEIQESWVWCRLGEITDYGSSPKAEPSDLKDDTWVLDLEDIEKATSNLLCKIRFNERNSLSTKSVFKAGDVLYSKLRPYLDKVIVADEDGVCTTEILPLKCYAGLNPYYFQYSLKRIDFLKYANSVTKGMKMPRLGTKEGQLALIPLPPLSEQKRIVEEIEKQFAKTKELKEHIIANQKGTEQLLKALLHQAFEVEEMETA